MALRAAEEVALELKPLNCDAGQGEPQQLLANYRP